MLAKFYAERLRAARRPKPPSLKEQTLPTTMNDYKKLCAELLAALEEKASNWNLDPECHPLVVRARAALAEPERPTDKELLCIAAKAIGGYGDGINPGEYEETTECAVEVYGSELCDFARAVLARWGHEQRGADIEAVKLADDYPPEGICTD